MDRAGLLDLGGSAGIVADRDGRGQYLAQDGGHHDRGDTDTTDRLFRSRHFLQQPGDLGVYRCSGAFRRKVTQVFGGSETAGQDYRIQIGSR